MPDPNLLIGAIVRTSHADTHVFNYYPDECDGFKFCAPNVNMQIMEAGFDDGMNQAWSLDIAGEDWDGASSLQP
jgi:hypothetical protein